MLTQHWVEDATGIHAEWIDEDVTQVAVEDDAN